jgi:glycosyltransferase involved in cell wall biosynthesis
MISIVIPVRNGGDDLRSCLERIGAQQIDDELEIVVVDSESTDGSARVAAAFGAKVHTIPAAEFQHGRTRNLGARLARGETLVFTSQDAQAASDDWLERLVAPLRARAEVAGAYGRQVPKSGTKPPERYFLNFLYGTQGRRQEAAGPADLTMDTTFFSNVNSAIRRDVWEEFPFAEDVVMSEDQEWCARVLLAGHSVVYEPRAAVYHSHDYSVAAAFRRFFDSGASSARSYLAGGGAASSTFRVTAREYAVGELNWLWRTGQRRWIPYAVVYELGKLVGLELGKRHRIIPTALKRRMTNYPGYWQ